LVKFYYDRLNITNDRIWVHKTNNIGLKKIWASKSTNVLSDVGMRLAPKT